MSSRLYRSLGLFLLFSMGGLAAAAQEPLTLRQAINQALGQSPEAAIARAGNLDAKRLPAMARTALLPQLGFTEDISRGDDPVYVFGSKLRQHQFTLADFACERLEPATADWQFLNPLLRLVDGIRFVQDAEGDPPRRSVQAKRLLLRQGG